MATPVPDYEGFAKRIFELTEWPGAFYDIESSDVFEAAKTYNLIRPIPGGFNPKVHEDEFGCAQPGDDWFETNF